MILLIFQMIFISSDAPRLAHLEKYYTPDLVDNLYNDITLPPSFMEKDVFSCMINEMFTQIVFDFENNCLYLQIQLFL